MMTICEICQQAICPPRCPNYDEPKTKGECIYCRKELKEGCEYYKDNEDNYFCSEGCAIEWHGIELKEWS